MMVIKIQATVPLVCKENNHSLPRGIALETVNPLHGMFKRLPPGIVATTVEYSVFYY